MANLRSQTGSRVGLFLAGLVIGALLLTIVPVGAHHNDTNFKNRLEALETKVKKLTAKTSNLDAKGDNYFGYVHSSWVWSSGDYGCAAGEDADWADAGDGFVWLSCPGGTLPSTARSAGGTRTRR
ncbi:MAG: hypothetical protein M3174_00260 [Actinomycetota bacterium]|nr:hypothetical protein [Actinomycetota bacterium]